jgi:hypothetical protein
MRKLLMATVAVAVVGLGGVALGQTDPWHNKDGLGITRKIACEKTTIKDVEKCTYSDNGEVIFSQQNDDGTTSDIPKPAGLTVHVHTAHQVQTPFDFTCGGKRQTGEGMAGTVVGVCHLAANTLNEEKVQQVCEDETDCEVKALVIGKYPNIDIVKILSVKKIIGNVGRE